MLLGFEVERICPAVDSNDSINVSATRLQSSRSKWLIERTGSVCCHRLRINGYESHPSHAIIHSRKIRIINEGCHEQHVTSMKKTACAEIVKRQKTIARKQMLNTFNAFHIHSFILCPKSLVISLARICSPQGSGPLTLVTASRNEFLLTVMGT